MQFTRTYFDDLLTKKREIEWRSLSAGRCPWRRKIKRGWQDADSITLSGDGSISLTLSLAYHHLVSTVLWINLSSSSIRFIEKQREEYLPHGKTDRDTDKKEKRDDDKVKMKYIRHPNEIIGKTSSPTQQTTTLQLGRGSTLNRRSAPLRQPQLDDTAQSTCVTDVDFLFFGVTCTGKLVCLRYWTCLQTLSLLFFLAEGAPSL